MKRLLPIFCVLILLIGCGTKEIDDYFAGMNSDYSIRDIKAHYGEPEEEEKNKVKDIDETILSYECELEGTPGTLSFVFEKKELQKVTWFSDKNVKEKDKDRVIRYLKKKFGKYEEEEKELSNHSYMTYEWETEDGTLTLTEGIT
ncbi:MAG: hypothetical protein KBT03_06150, partial [Bacteroidales bacterium]|nr:hypothetical protein [Candidatus Scybalousia scybalohippi]